MGGMCFVLSRLDTGYEFLTPDGPDDDLSDCLAEAMVGYTGGWKARLSLLERLLSQELVAGEDWRDALLDHHEDVRERARIWGAEEAGLICTPDKNPAWQTWNVDREDGPVDHYMMGFTTARQFFAALIRRGIREEKSQNPFERDLWHLEGDDGRWTYCVRRYGDKASHAYPHAGAYFLPMERRPYHRSLFNPAGVGKRMATAMRNRIGDHVGTNVLEVIGDDPARFGDFINSSGLDWPDLGDVLYARNKGGGDEYDKPLVLTGATLEGLYRRIDLDHAEDPQNRPSVKQLKALWAADDEDALRAFKVFQKKPSQGDGPPSYSSIHELVKKACIAEDVTVGRGSAKRLATMRWPRREKVDGKMLAAHRESKTMGQLEKRRKDIQVEMGWKTDQTSNYGSHAEQQAAVERKREQNEADKARQEAEARGERSHERRPMSDVARDAASSAMRRTSP